MSDNSFTSSARDETSLRLALVTGASRGIGRALAEALAARGWHVVAVARTAGALEEMDDRVQRAGGHATLAPMDITQDDAMRHLCRSIHDRWGRLDLWVHSAIHAPPMSPAGHVAPKDWDKTIATNIRATGMLIPMIEPLLLAAGAGAQAGDDSGAGQPAPRRGPGTALFFDDARAGERFFGAYGASKAAQIALARSWQAEAARIGPRVLIDTPAAMPTATRARFFPGEDRSRLTPCADEAARLCALLETPPAQG
ncbi:SDR family NAD(P)-dependent oxidoreductase [Alkalilacustris brevis]|uniref:SDR family NAD(P)-dependent oxidoreductase n=1 Tax=Alkalilacustris brevis TaxID=2026338 RepID=UPI000E0D9A39|nr:SDR family oxidoreductase [Alkalilacustris brevis]